MKFGKQIQKRQLEVPEYAASFVNYKALKKLIKRLSATPTLAAINDVHRPSTPLDPQTALQANKATFFFQLVRQTLFGESCSFLTRGLFTPSQERELEKVNAFYLQKEAELKVRLRTLLDKKKVLQSRPTSIARRSAKFTTLEEGFQQFALDLNKLQQFVEINGTAFSKILKKWDKTSKSKTKELYLSRAVEVQPFFNPTVISELSDQATTSLQELGAWRDGDQVNFEDRQEHVVTTTVGTDEGDADVLLLDTVIAGNIDMLKDLLARMKGSLESGSTTEPAVVERVTRAFLSAIHDAPLEALEVLLDTWLVDIQSEDDINERNCLHQAAIYGREEILQYGLAKGVSADRMDVYGRVPLHYASVHGRLDMLDALLKASPGTINLIDHDNFTPLIHAIIHDRYECVERLLEQKARLDPTSDADHVPLNLACEHGSVRIVELLLQHGAKIVPDAEGLYPQHLVARSAKTPEILVRLQNHGADLNQADKLYGWTPLIHAASEGNVACLQALIDVGADPNITDEKDLPAVYYAAWEGHLECMKLLAAYNPRMRVSPQISTPLQLQSGVIIPPLPIVSPLGSLMGTSSGPMSIALDLDAIPELELPPPIIPLRRYGHNFLDTKTVVQIHFGENGDAPLAFFHGSKYPAARLTISSKATDLIPKNIILPFQEDTRLVSFQVDNLDNFTLDFDVFPTYGAKIIGKTVALPSTFRANTCHMNLPLFDPRLRAIGQISFTTQVIKPFNGKPLEITDFETYWKATSQFETPHPSSVVTGSSLSGDYVRIYVQQTSDGVPVLWPRWTIQCGGLDVPVCRLTLEQFMSMTARSSARAEVNNLMSMPMDAIAQIHTILANAGIELENGLALLPHWMHVNIQVLYPTPEEEQLYNLGPAADLNAFTDAVLSIVFDHARAQRGQTPDIVRSIVFSSYNMSLCTALNWKQPNFPVFLCNDLGREEAIAPPNIIQASGRRAVSIKEAVRVAQSNNFMGLICTGVLLDSVPALIDAIKSHGLALVMDRSLEAVSVEAAMGGRLPEGIDGVLRSHGVLRFNESIDM